MLGHSCTYQLVSYAILVVITKYFLEGVDIIDITTFILGFILFFNILLALTIVFLERKDASSTWAWLLVLTFIPVVGFILYLIFGRQLSKKNIFTWDTKSRLGVVTTVQNQLKELKEGTFEFKQDELIPYKDLFYLHLRNDEAILTQDNDVKIFTDGKKKFESLLNDIKQAKDHVHLLYYIIRHDQLGEAIADALIQKINEGVQVRILYDDMGSRRLSKKYVRKLRAAGGEVESFFPPLIPNVNLKINYRNHRKLAIIYGKIG